jgi:carboxypeptidase C (cathepsin A)
MSDTPSTAAADPKDNSQQVHVDALLARSTSRHEGSTVLADGQRLAWCAQAEFLPVPAADTPHGPPQAAVMVTAYVVPGGSTPRPVCFAFNGGPGSASLWLHLGALGPKRVAVPSDGSMPAPPYAVVDNPLTWLAHFDLVFIDPPGTGWSAVSGSAAAKDLYSVDGDIAAMAEVVRAWLARHRRFGSPLVLVGESYGTTRGAAMADRLASDGVALSGLVLVSCAMDFQSFVFAPRNDLPHALFLPAFANVAQYHGCLGGALGQTSLAAREAAEAFVASDYLAALHAGQRLAPRQRQRVVRRLAELTGLPAALVDEKNLRITDQDFFFELLRPRGLQVGRLEARATSPLGARRGRQWEFDPGIEALAAPYTQAALGWLAELGAALPQRYEALNPAVGRAWQWQRKRLAGGPDEDDPGSCAAPQPAPARAGGQRPLRPGHALQRQ